MPPPAALAPELAERLVKICGRLGSDFDGERAAAGLLASRLIADHGLTWGDVIGSTMVVAKPADAPVRPARTNKPERFSFADLSASAARVEIKAMFDAGHFTAWEEDFLAGCDDALYRRPDRCLTNKQVQILNRLWRKTYGDE